MSKDEGMRGQSHEGRDRHIWVETQSEVKLALHRLAFDTSSTGDQDAFLGDLVRLTQAVTSLSGQYVSVETIRAKVERLISESRSSVREIDVEELIVAVADISDRH